MTVSEDYERLFVLMASHNMSFINSSSEKKVMVGQCRQGFSSSLHCCGFLLRLDEAVTHKQKLLSSWIEVHLYFVF